ncbi:MULTISPECIES: CDP-glycerol glycerophosphotransferase family protein [Staphylococcus]|uniref:CDP-glycerol glycerophosphotransferase family protein n=1 Tax=Staphylococcus TaxID=1279 RepID=UPI0008A5D435|nr:MULTISPECIES: CDP-glycerol glycerophosphotransferase family protein [Staphylococcus]OFP04332.1 teichoic acid biosynthesis protein [Staphylococcus sp. HMSC065E08]
MNKPKVIVNEIFWERIQIYLKGYIQQSQIAQGYFFLYDTVNEKYLELHNVQFAENEFICRFNIATVNNGMHLNIGDYALVYMEKGNCCKTAVNVEILKDNEKNKRRGYCLNDFSKEFKQETKYKHKNYTVSPVLKFDEGTYDLIIRITYEEKAKKIYERKDYFKKILTDLKNINASLRDSIFKLIFNTSKVLHWKKNSTVLFTSESRTEMSGNFHYIAREMFEQKLDSEYRIYQIFKGHVSERYKFIDKLKLPYLLGKADYIFVDDFHPTLSKVKFRSNQEIIQLWHAVGAFKTVVYSRIGKRDGPYFDSKGHRKYTKVYVSSSSDIPIYAEAFGVKEENIVATGVPRTDVFFHKINEKIAKNKITEKIPLIKEKNVILFAPTFRGSGHLTAFYPMDKIDFEQLAEYCQQSNSIVLFKMHPFIKEYIKIPPEYSNLLVDISNFREVNDVLFATDLLITDYSSLIYEFAILKRPMIFYAFDLEEYILNRDFYQPYETFVPGKIVKTFNQLMNSLYEHDYEFEKVNKFLNNHYNYFDGYSSKRIVKDLFLKS